MKKIALSILGIALVFSLSACGQKDKPKNNSQKEELKMSLVDRLLGEAGMKCVFPAPEGEMVVYSQNGKVRVEGVPYFYGSNADPANPPAGVQLTDEEWMYMWSGQEGTKMNIKKLEQLADGMEEEESEKPEDWQDMIEGYEEDGIDYSCEEKNLPADLFVPPQDVEFTDFTEFMTGMAEMGQQINQQMEAGEEMDMEEMMQRMQEQIGTPYQE